METVSYLPVLRRFGFRATARYPWAVIGRTRRTQGWKLHLSSVQAETPRLLETVLPLLRDARVSFKVAQHDGVVALLNEGEFGPTQVGKIITIYPESDDRARALAEHLVARTRDFRGPAIITDLSLGAVVYARYGSFSPVIKRDRLGYAVPMIRDASGELSLDRYTVPFASPSHVTNPFSGLADSRAPTSPDAPVQQRRIGHYLVLHPLRLRPFGGSLLALDVREQKSVALKVLKFGRPHCLSDDHGRDIRDRLKRQAALHAALADRVPVPGADPYFEVDDYGYAGFDHVDGSNLEALLDARWREQPWRSRSARANALVIQTIVDVVVAVRALHRAGYLHRDLSPSNILRRTDGTVALLDLELAYPIGGSEPAFGMGTAGFMSPQQAARDQPSTADDVYAIGALLTFFLTSLDPRRVVFPGDTDRHARIGRLAEGAPAELVDVACACLADVAAARPSLEDVERVINDLVGKRQVAPVSPKPMSSAAIHDVVERGLLAIVNEAATSGGIWRSVRSPSHAGRASTVFEVERHANRGVAGVVYLLARASRTGFSTNACRHVAARAARWLIDTTPTDIERLPGLHFGEAGVAVALAECVAAGVLPRARRTIAVIDRGLSGVLDWPDITHGAAGQGMAAIACAERLPDRSLLSHVDRTVEFLLRAQSPDGSWTLPPGIDGLSGQTLTGFAHGTAGITFFLVEYSRRLGAVDVRGAIDRATSWLLKQSRRRGSHLEWSYGTHTRERWHRWCHGGPGIALLFLKRYEYTRNRRYAEAARAALDAIPVDLRTSNLTQCHGLAGLGEIFLEAARVLRDDRWRQRAHDIANDLVALARDDGAGGLYWLAEDPYLVSPDLMVGYGGIVHFLMRLTTSGRGLSYPLLLDPHDA